MGKLAFKHNLKPDFAQSLGVDRSPVARGLIPVGLRSSPRTVFAVCQLRFSLANQ